MELDDLKTTWDSAGDGAVNQELTARIIDRVTQQKYRSAIRKIKYPEATGAGICLVAAIWIGLHFSALDTIFLQGTGILAILLLLAIPLISLASLRPLHHTPALDKPCTEVLHRFREQSAVFYRLQKINLVLSYLLLVAVIILLSKLFAGKDITGNKFFWTLAFCSGYLFLLFFSTYVAGAYKRILKQTGDALQET